MPDSILYDWLDGLPNGPLQLVSLLGHKPVTGHDEGDLSEFKAYPFKSITERGSKPTLAEWLEARRPKRFVVHEFPTVDLQIIDGKIVAAVSELTTRLLAADLTVILMDSGGVSRTGQVCRAMGFRRSV